MMTDPSSPGFWETNYRDGRLNWDLGGPTPVFCRLVGDPAYPPGRTIVLGAGLGHDARLFARHGHQVTALDFAPGAARAMHALQDAQHPVVILQADFFHLPPLLDGRFDYALDYVFFCAIDPARREEYAAAVARLLAPGGLLVLLAFPTDDHDGGPPFTVQPESVIKLCEGHGLELTHREAPPETIMPRRGREELLVFRRV